MLRYFLFLLICSLTTVSCGGGSNDSSSSSKSSSSESSLANSSASSDTPSADGSVCPAYEPCKIMVLGDSIAQGIGTTDAGYSLNGGFRVPLFRMAKNDGYNITFIGRREDGPDTVDGVPFPRNHEGYAGLQIKNLARMIPEPILETVPNIVLLHVGMGDVHGSNIGAQNTNGFTEELSLLYNIIQDILIKDPNTLVAVSDLIEVSGYRDPGVAFARGVGDVVEQLNQNIPTANVVLVRHFQRHPAGSVGNDFTHLNEEGYQWMAEQWYQAISPYL